MADLTGPSAATRRGYLRIAREHAERLAASEMAGVKPTMKEHAKAIGVSERLFGGP